MMIQEQKEDLKNQAITSNRMAITVPGLVIKQHKVDWYAVKIRGKDLMGAGINLEVDEWTMKKLSRVKYQVYQRVLQSKHANEFAAFIENENNSLCIGPARLPGAAFVYLVVLNE